MLQEGVIPNRGGVWIDCYNQTTSDIAGTILAGMIDKNHYFVTMEQSILTPKRTEKAKELRRQGINSFEDTELQPREDGISNSLTSLDEDNLLIEPKLLGWTRDEKGVVTDWHSVDIANTQTPCNRPNTQNYIAEPINTYSDGVSRTIKAQYDQTSVANFNRTDAFAATGVAVHPLSRKLEFRGFDESSAPALRSTDYKCPHCYSNGFRIRKLTERECFRLMDVPDAYIDKIQDAGISRHQQYRMAGNSIVVNCLYLIFRNLFIGSDEQPQQLTLF